MINSKIKAIASSGELELQQASSQGVFVNCLQQQITNIIPKIQKVKFQNSSRYSLLIQTFLFALVFSVVKFLVSNYTSFKGLLVITDLTLIYTGLFFITGILFSMVNADLKQAQKMPSEMVSSLQQLQECFMACVLIPGNKSDPKIMFNVYKHIIHLANNWKQSLFGAPQQIQDVRVQLHMLSKLLFQITGTANHLTILTINVVDKIRRISQRSSAIKRVWVLPMAHGLAQFFVLVSTIMLFLVKYNNEATQFIIMLTVYTVTWLIIRLVDYIDDPFQEQIFLGWQQLLGYNRLIHLFVLDQYVIRILQKIGFLDITLQVIPGSKMQQLLKEEAVQTVAKDGNITRLGMMAFSHLVAH